MTTGIEVYNTNGDLLVSSSERNIYVIQSGFVSQRPPQVGNTVQDYRLEIPVNSVPISAPIIAVRPSQVNAYVGGFQWWPGFQRLNYIVQCQSPFHWVVLSPEGTPIGSGGNSGLEVFDETGLKVTFSSNYKYARLRNLFVRPPTAGGVGWPMTRTISGFSTIPWFIVNNLRRTERGISETSESYGAIMGMVNSGFSSVTYNFMDIGPGNSVPFPNLVDRAAYDPFANVQEALWLAEIPGL